jgi:uncharacterized RDD family membrane protein YckC
VTQIEPPDDKPKPRKRLVEIPIEVPVGIAAFLIGSAIGGFLQWIGFGLIGSLLRIVGFGLLAWYAYIKFKR